MGKPQSPNFVDGLVRLGNLGPLPLGSSQTKRDRGFEFGNGLEGLGFRVSGLGFRISGLGFRVEICNQTTPGLSWSSIPDCARLEANLFP